MARKKKTGAAAGGVAGKARAAKGATADGGRKWSGAVTRNSNALDLDKGVFKKDNPAKIARSLERSADKSDRKKSDSYRSAMSMLSFYINRAGKNLPAAQKRILEKAKDILKDDHENNTPPGKGKKTGSPSTTRVTAKTAATARTRTK